MQFTMKPITVWNGHTQLMFTFYDLGRPRVLSFFERLVCISLYNYIRIQPIMCIVAQWQKKLFALISTNGSDHAHGNVVQAMIIS